MKLDLIQRRILIIYAIILAAGGLYTAWIYAVGFGMPCYFHELTGFQCPGCGSSRMFLALFRGNVQTAIGYNTVAFFAFPTWIVISALAFAGHPMWARSPRFLWGAFSVTIGVYVAFGLLRNFI